MCLASTVIQRTMLLCWAVGFVSRRPLSKLGHMLQQTLLLHYATCLVGMWCMFVRLCVVERGVVGHGGRTDSALKQSSDSVVCL